MSNSDVVYAGVEAGGTSFSVGIAHGTPDNVVERQSFPTTTPDETLAAVVAWLKERKFDSLGIASFGPIDPVPSSPTYGFITTTPKPRWNMTPVLKAFEQFKCPKGFDTDVNGAALSEARLGLHRQDKYPTGSGKDSIGSCAYITVGTGVGVGLMVEERPVHGLLHPEMGHICTPRHPADIASGFEGTCPFHKGCIEGMVSNGSLASRLGLPAEELPKVPDDHPVWETVGFYLAHLCTTLVLTVSPEVIVLGGGVMNRSILYPIVQRTARALLNGYIASPVFESDEAVAKYIVKSRFATEKATPGMVGAMELAKIALDHHRSKH
eukprot:TRINITY_DN3342_c0_g2_i1.p1 TRINITY_DN3342_c0_g2~~TRINITY_DN3342_c0_g2_i1.p1  ORF type:complete len:324 (+),score=39.02 TRINITY_DN3342_c0_g2_i1:31-1002(+)